MFINYDPFDGLSINSYRNPKASAGDIADLIEALTKSGGPIVCDLDGAKDALEDGEYWQGRHYSVEAIEEVHALICEYECWQ